MIIKDFRYILKRIIIGVGICIVLSLLNNNNVLAYDEDVFKIVSCSQNVNASVGDNYTFYINNFNYNIEYKNDGIYINDILYISSSDYLQRRFAIGYIDNTLMVFLVKFNSSSYNWVGMNADDTSWNNVPNVIHFLSNGNYISGNRIDFNKSTGNYIRNNSFSNILQLIGNGVNNYAFYGSNQQWGAYNNTCLISKKDSERIFISKISSLGEQLIYNDNNILTNVRFSPTYENFNISKYNYQYKIGNNNWLNITSEGATFNVNQNTTVYFRVVNKSNDSVVDSRTYTITQIGLYDINTDTYKVKYTSENKSVGEETSSTTGFVNEVSVYFEYFPKISNLKYQYQFVENGSSLGTWENMSSNDYERTYTTDVNGTLYNRILDENDNILYTSTFNVNSIGNIFVDENSNNNFFNKLQSKFKSSGYGKNIQDIFFLPVKLIQVEHDALLSELCMPFDLGVLFGTHLIMPCIDVKSYVGNNIYYFIDMVFSIVVILGIINFVVSTYNSIVFMETGKFERDKNMIEGRK